ncbi:hypothetical protein GCM10007304_16450 [Rhodococcoides trifolii]|uniref:YtxH domain-containing protein n=1 Tax=Rhodococcoides trifolii TaxID=908250 RepID=A0A917CZ05_9NOCA|nr:hypothetical protein [Rhodococcus trifolii]GGG03104.1 hypothetical protein GCM10007304_16450 [Rhodococcus trifolii]
MMRMLVGIAAGYVLGTKAGRGRYEQISRGAKAVASSPATKKVLKTGRQKLSESLSTEPKMEQLRPIDEQTVFVPRDHLKRG